MTQALFVLAAGIGAALRHAVNRTGRGSGATLAVNVVGSLLLGLLVGSEPSSAALTVIGTGLLGSFTTFSLFALEVAEQRPAHRIAIVAASLLLGIGAAAIGFALA